MRIQLSDHFTYSRLIKFTLPSIGMMLFTSIYGVVDGLFVSNYVGKTTFAAVNLMVPLMMIVAALGFMVGAGGTAIVAKTLGEKQRELANRYFSLMVYVVAIGGAILGGVGIAVARPVGILLGAEGELLEYCVQYSRIVLVAMPCFMLQYCFQSFLVAAEKPRLGLYVTLAAGVTNMILDALFVAVFRWGLVGAAVATSLSQTVGAVVPVVYFARKNDSLLRLGKTQFYGRVLLKTCTNGSSELMGNISASVVTVLYNRQLLKLAGENGVAAYGVIMYIGFIFAAIFIGYAVGAAPVVGFHYGAKNTDELHNLLVKSVRLNVGTGIAATVFCFALSVPMCRLFVGYDGTLYDMTLRGMRLYSLAFLLCGCNIFGSAFFTALNNGLVSAVISFLRTLVFQSGMVLLFPILFGMDGIWYSCVAAEIAALIVVVSFLFAQRKKYQY